MPEGIAGGGSKATGYTEFRDRDGNLLVAFNSEDTKGYWGNRYQAARIRYCMSHRGKIPDYLRTGKKPFWGKRIMTLILEKKLKQGGNLL